MAFCFFVFFFCSFPWLSEFCTKVGYSSSEDRYRQHQNTFATRILSRSTLHTKKPCHACYKNAPFVLLPSPLHGLMKTHLNLPRTVVGLS